MLYNSAKFPRSVLNFSRHFHNLTKLSSIHPFDTNKFVSRLEGNGFSREQANVIMELTKASMIEKNHLVEEVMLTKSDLEKDMYLFKAALSELRTEIQILRRKEEADLKSTTDSLSREVTSLGHRIQEDVYVLKNELQIDLDDHQGEMNRMFSKSSMHRLAWLNQTSLNLAQIRTSIEAIKLDSIGSGILVVLGFGGLWGLYLWLNSPTVHIQTVYQDSNSNEAVSMEL